MKTPAVKGLFAVIAAVFVAGSAWADSPRYDVYLLAGQSNMCGRGPLPATPYDLTNVQIWNGSAWVQAVEPFFHDLSTSGAGLAASFARKMADAEPGVVVRLVPAAVGDTGMSRWIPEGDLYQAAVTMTRAAVANGGGTLKGILWHQGEADSGSTANAQNYAANFTRMVNQFRTDLGSVASDPVIPVVAGELGRYFGDPDNTHCTYWQTVNNQLRTVAKTLDNVYLISSEGLTPKDDKIHFDTPSLRTLGVRYSVAFLNPSALPVLEPPEPPAPPGTDPSKNVSTFDYVQDGLVAQWDGVENAGRFRHSDAIAVWKDLVGGSEITLASGKSLVGANFVQVLKSKEIAGSCPELGIDRPKTIEICAHCVAMGSNTSGSYMLVNGGHKYILSREVTDGWLFTYDDGNNERVYRRGLSTVDTTAMHTFSCGYPGTTFKFSYDGQSVAVPGDDAIKPASTARSCNEAFTLGKDTRPASFEFYSIRIYSRLLTAEEIAHNHAIDVARFIEGKAGWCDVLYVSGVPADFGSVSPAYGPHANVFGGMRFAGTAEAPIPVGQTNITCLGYVVYTNGAYEAGREYQQGTTSSFTYVQPEKTAAELVWKWNLAEDLTLPKVVGVTAASANPNELTVRGNLASMTGASCELSVVVSGGRLSDPLVFEGLAGSTLSATGDFELTVSVPDDPDAPTYLHPGVTYDVKVLAKTGDKKALSVETATVKMPLGLSAASYVQDGLVAQWDGKENAGRGQHSSTLTEWVDLVGTNRIAIASGAATINDDSVITAKAKALSGSCQELASGPTGSLTLEFLARAVNLDGASTSQMPYIFIGGAYRYISPLPSDGFRFSYLSRKSGSGYIRDYKKTTPANLNCQDGQHHTLSFGFFDLGMTLSVDGANFDEKLTSCSEGTLITGDSIKGGPAFTLGKDARTGSHSYRSIRFYSKNLTPGEIRQNRWIDQLRYEGANLEDLLPEGTRMLVDGTVQCRIGIDAHGAGVRYGGSAEGFAEGKHMWWKPLPSATIEAEPKSGWLYGWVGAPQAGASWTDGGATMTWDVDGALSLYLDAFEPSASVRHIAPGAVEELASMQGVKSLHVGALQGETGAAVCRIGGQVEVTAENGGYAIVENRGSTLRKTTFTLLNGGTLKLLADAEFHDLEMPDAADKLDLNGFKLSLRSPTHQNTDWAGQIVDSSVGKTGRIEWVRAGFMLMIK